MSQRRPSRAAVLSAEPWGTAAAKILADAGTRVVLHACRREIADAINARRRNPGYFPDIELPATKTATTDPAAALDGADYLVLSVPRAVSAPMPVGLRFLEAATGPPTCHSKEDR